MENSIDEVQELRAPYHPTDNKLNKPFVRSQSTVRERQHIQDLHHKIGNQAQLVTSIINLQKIQVEGLNALKQLESLHDRVHFIALLERLVIRYGNGVSVPLNQFMEDLVREITRHTKEGKKATIKKRINEVQIQEKKAVAFGLFIFEVVVNALKHAFRGNQNGTISILLMPCGFDKCLLEISDNGNGYQNTKNNKGIGISLMSALSEQLGGEIKTMCSNQGTTIKVVFAL